VPFTNRAFYWPIGRYADIYQEGKNEAIPPPTAISNLTTSEAKWEEGPAIRSPQTRSQSRTPRATTGSISVLDMGAGIKIGSREGWGGGLEVWRIFLIAARRPSSHCLETRRISSWQPHVHDIDKDVRTNWPIRGAKQNSPTPLLNSWDADMQATRSLCQTSPAAYRCPYENSRSNIAGWYASGAKPLLDRDLRLAAFPTRHPISNTSYCQGPENDRTESKTLHFTPHKMESSYSHWNWAFE